MDLGGPLRLLPGEEEVERSPQEISKSPDVPQGERKGRESSVDRDGLC